MFFYKLNLGQSYLLLNISLQIKICMTFMKFNWSPELEKCKLFLKERPFKYKCEYTRRFFIICHIFNFQNSYEQSIRLAEGHTGCILGSGILQLPNILGQVVN